MGEAREAGAAGTAGTARTRVRTARRTHLRDGSPNPLHLALLAQNLLEGVVVSQLRRELQRGERMDLELRRERAHPRQLILIRQLALGQVLRQKLVHGAQAVGDGSVHRQKARLLAAIGAVVQIDET